VTLAINVQESFVTPVVSGAIQGAIYGLMGLGLVLLYKGNRIFNFAQGEFGTLAAFVAFAFYTGTHGLPKLPYGLALVIGLVAGVVIGLTTERLVARPLFRQPKVTLVVASAGVALLAISLELIWFGTNPNFFRPIVQGTAFEAGGLLITWQQVIIVCVLGLLAAASFLFFKFSRMGIAILAVSQEPTATSLVGISVNRISAFTWGLAGFLGAVAGLLLAPTTLFSAGFMTLTALIPGFTAAVFGGITSLPGAFLGGVVIGIIEQVGNRPVFSKFFPGANRVLVFAALLIVLLVRPSGLLGKET
jgi:branched-chain amino acid transport system permease protein